MTGRGAQGQESRAPLVTNVTATQTLEWDCFVGRPASEALREIHGHANALVGWTLAGNVARPAESTA